ncbi:(Fe-S)-binding protein [Beggiatoa leptomitoformis]|uniref:(Fe-S)-binding protein n=1 Tax=Beggiatoa leptomitoformis TaxID=288004 RepID=A0A2N9YID8_9GAMM|nr:(Fe-S)-binding protein [Beggiatoa leptomitoformis]ALG67510.1 (Fe-S)-binding protein [Beggiatoa leptomitoformis]AUI70267.1 (Fe-S)-binding protein [Beggiatoa leptomitoformis]
MNTTNSPRVALFVTCLVDMFRPSVGFAALKLLTQAGCHVDVPTAQTCCGQPAYNNGDVADTEAIAKNVITAFQDYDYVVAPSGSCAGMLRHHYTELFQTDPVWQEKARQFSAKCHELISFLVDVCKLTTVHAEFAQSVTYHDSCSGLRELNVKQQPRQLLQSVNGLQLLEMPDCEVCCGFGGTFCIKYPDISTRMVSDKVLDIQNTGAQTLLAGDLGCLLNMAGRLSRLNVPVKAYHVAEVLADMTQITPAIGKKQG